MFVRQKQNKSGVISIQIISKGRGKYQLVETIGSSSDPLRVGELRQQARERILVLAQQSSFNFDIDKERALSDMFFTGLNEICLMGPELLLGKLFDEIGFGSSTMERSLM
jgi:hypothetical protein